MKGKSVAVGLICLFSIGLWSCSDDQKSEDLQSLKTSLSQETVSLKKAVGEISQSKGFQILTMGDNTTKSEESDSHFTANITIDQLKGIYDYQLTPAQEGSHMNKFFAKTEESEQFIVRLPKEKANNPGALFNVSEEDSDLVNDFVITTSDFLYNYQGGLSFNYLLDTRIDVEDAFAGFLKINWTMSSLAHMDYSASYGFTDEYSLGVEFQTGDTMSYMYNLKQSENLPYQERISFIKSDDLFKGEREYALTIGNVEIVKNSSLETIQVYKDGVLQENATVEFVDTEQSEENLEAFCHMGRDLKITFDDETSVLLSELVGDSLETLHTLFKSLGDVYFAKHLVNHIALDINNSQQ